ncbi:helix-turn-helix domain-containing protein [Planococcus kocurii]|uniref:helix-turn-helix domain-containing protein n=1 Tax=Planococcus kocurii TaxID=1374 RepID=UPI003CFE0EC1
MYVHVNLKEILNEKNMSQRELSKVTGIRAASIHDMYNNQVIRLPLKNLALICAVLNCSIADLLQLRSKEDETD